MMNLRVRCCARWAGWSIIVFSGRRSDAVVASPVGVLASIRCFDTYGTSRTAPASRSRDGGANGRRGMVVFEGCEDVLFWDRAEVINEGGAQYLQGAAYLIVAERDELFFQRRLLHAARSAFVLLYLSGGIRRHHPDDPLPKPEMVCLEVWHCHPPQLIIMWILVKSERRSGDFW